MIQQRISHARGEPQNAAVHTYGLGEPRQIIEQLRVARGFRSVRALALAADIPQPTLSRYLKGVNATMELTNFQALAKALDVTLSELLGEVPLSSRREVRELARLMDKLDEPERRALLAAGQAMVDATNKSPRQ